MMFSSSIQKPEIIYISKTKDLNQGARLSRQEISNRNFPSLRVGTGLLSTQLPPAFIAMRLVNPTRHNWGRAHVVLVGYQTLPVLPPVTQSPWPSHSWKQSSSAFMLPIPANTGTWTLPAGGCLAESPSVCMCTCKCCSNIHVTASLVTVPEHYHQVAG
jgi:hypothetical protein